MPDTEVRHALLDEAAASNVPNHATTPQNSLEDSIARNKRRAMSRLDILLAHEPGKTVTVPCKESDTIEVVLKWIRNKLGIKIDDLYRDDLYVNGRLIQSKDKTIGDSRIFGHVLTYHRRIKRPSIIYVMMLSGRVLEVACGLDKKARDFKYAIADKIYTHPEDTRLLFNGNRLDDNLTLAECGVQHGTTVYLLFILGGKQFAENRVTFKSILDVPGTLPGELTPIGSTFLWKGVYIESRCVCSPGKAHISPHRMSGLCELSELYPNCGDCNQKVRATVVGVGFVECQYRFFGIRKTGEQVSSEWKSIAGNRYARLDPGVMLTDWRRLIFETAKLGEDDNCSICLSEFSRGYEEYSDGKINDSGRCGHVFHADCREEYTAGVCPGCDLNRHLVGDSS